MYNWFSIYHKYTRSTPSQSNLNLYTMSDSEYSTSDSDYLPPAGSEDKFSANEFVDEHQDLENELQAKGPDDPNNQRITSDDFTYVTYDDDQAP